MLKGRSNRRWSWRSGRHLPLHCKARVPHAPEPTTTFCRHLLDHRRDGAVDRRGHAGGRGDAAGQLQHPGCGTGGALAQQLAGRVERLELQAVGRASPPGDPGERDVRNDGRELGGALAAAQEQRVLRLRLQLRLDDRDDVDVGPHLVGRPDRHLCRSALDVRQQGALLDREVQGRPRGPLAGRHDAELLPEVPGWCRQGRPPGRARSLEPRDDAGWPRELRDVTRCGAARLWCRS